MKLLTALFLSLAINFVLSSCSHEDRVGVDNNIDKDIDIDIFEDTTLTTIYEEIEANLIIKEGYISNKADTLRIVRDEETIAIVILSEPQIVAQSATDEAWGFFQFPKIFRAENGNLIVYWQMKADSHTAYGEESYGFRMSRDEGLTWESLDREYFRREPRRFESPNGDVYQITDFTPRDINSFSTFPQPVNNKPIIGHNFYYESELPEELRGAYAILWNPIGNTLDTIHVTIEDPASLKYTIDEMMPIVWWGDIRETKENTLVTGVYPAFYLEKDGNVLNSTTSFYESKDNGHTWEKLGVVPNKGDVVPLLYDGSEGLGEPTFEILKDGSYVCIMRTGHTSPMVRSFSRDHGRTWTEPEPFTSNGVLPQLLKLDNGALVLASGRPGLQIRFNIDCDGKTWTVPIEMMSYMDENGNCDTWGTCGYPCVIKGNDDYSFYMVYSNFRIKNEKGAYVKNILFRKVETLKK